MVKLLHIPADVDLATFARFLWQQHISHRIRNHDGYQELWLADPKDAELVLALYRHWLNGDSLEAFMGERSMPSNSMAGNRLRQQWTAAPLTLSLIFCSLGLTLLCEFGDNASWLRWFTFVDFALQGNSLLFQKIMTVFTEGQWWRLITPVFLHFSLLHLLFNLLWAWVLGQRIERLQGTRVLLMLVLVLGVVSNLAQFLVTGPLFGGLSGVVFGLMAYTWLWDRLNPGRNFGLPPALMGFMVIMLVLGVTGVFEMMEFGAIANTAHLAGLLAGLACACLGTLIRRRTKRH
jgi:GlpG protein